MDENIKRRLGSWIEAAGSDQFSTTYYSRKKGTGRWEDETLAWKQHLIGASVVDEFVL